MHGILLIVRAVYSFLMSCNIIKNKRDASQQDKKEYDASHASQHLSITDASQ